MSARRKHGIDSKAAIRELDEVIARIASSRALLKDFFDDLFTPAEREEIAMRWQIIKRLHAGESQRSIVDHLGVGATTVSRGSRTLLNARGGFNQAIAKVTKKT